MKHPNPHMLVRIAQGDAYAMACEYISLPRDRAVHEAALRFEQFLEHPRHRVGAGRYTDDTQMSIAVTHVLLAGDLTREAFARSFVDCFKRDEREGYARNFQKLLGEVENGEGLLAKVRPDSDKNGAAMRSVPIGVLSDPEHVREVATTQAKITHDTEGGVDASIAVALMSHYALHVDEPLANVRLWLGRQMTRAKIIDAPFRDRVEAPQVGWKTAMAVLALVEGEATLLDIARRTIERGGDTDSVLAIAWGIASARMHEPLPEFFARDLERGPFGRDFLERLGIELMERFQ